MTETTDEQLNRLKMTPLKMVTATECQVNKQDYLWVMTQADRMRSVRKDHKRLERTIEFKNKTIGVQHKKNLEDFQEIKRLREALEFIATTDKAGAPQRWYISEFREKARHTLGVECRD